MDRDARQAAVHSVAQSWTRLKWLSPHSPSFSMNFPLLSSWREEALPTWNSGFWLWRWRKWAKRNRTGRSLRWLYQSESWGETDGALRRGHWKKLDWRIVYREVAGFKAAPQRCGSTPGLITPVSGYRLQPPAARSGGCRCCWNPGWQLSRKGPRGKRTWPHSPPFLLLPAKIPHWPRSVGSQKTKGPGDIIRLGRPQSRPQSRIAGEAGEAIGGCPAQHVSENIYLSRQEEEWEMLPEPCRQRKRGVGVFRESRRSLSDRSLCCFCCCCCWGCVCFATPWTIQPMEFSRPEYWSG